MLQPKRYIPLISFLGAMIISGNAMAHTTVMSKNTPDSYNSRDELEGNTSLNHFSIPHGCDGQSIRAQSVVFPNGADSIAERTDTGESGYLAGHIKGNPGRGSEP